MNILVVDDEIIIIETLRRGLRSKGYQVLAALSGQEAITILNNDKKIDLVLTDYVMPGMNGMELIRMVREKDAALPVIVMTAYGKKELVIDALRNRCDSFIEKPFTLKQLMHEIEAVEQHTTNIKDRVCTPLLEDKLRRGNDFQRVVNAFLRFSLEEMNLNEILYRAIDLIVSIPWLSFESQGGIFLMEEKSNRLKLIAKKHLNEEIQKRCDRICMDQCLCGRVAKTGKLIFADSIDEHHDITYDGMQPHGHYCVPILLRGKLLGVIVLYVPDGHRREKKEEEFLCAIANTLAGVIHHKKTEEDREMMRSQLLHAQKMEAVGTLAGGIAHDFNNLIQVMQGFVQLLLFDKNEKSEEYEELKQIEKAARKAGDLTQQILTFSRKMGSSPRPLNLNYEIRQAKKLLQRTLPKMIKIDLRLKKNLRPINADPSELNQILMNLAVNARDALADKGALIIETDRVIIDHQYDEAHPEVRLGEYILLTVTDTGHGMDKETLKYIFDPFYTTKEVGKGTGLGLSMVYGIVKSYKGYITCHSEIGVGTSFKIHLPVINEPIELEEAVKVETAKGGKGTILLVDDEKSLRNLGKQILNKFGYQVLTASNGSEALEIIQKTQKTEGILFPNLVILDLIMPGMGGKACLRQILKIDPRAKVLIASGYAIKGQAQDALEAGAKGFVSKPYSIEQMLTLVQKVLET